MDPNPIPFIKLAWMSFIGWLTGVYFYFEPIHYVWKVAIILWAVNVVVGYIAGMVINDEKLDWKKFMRAFLEMGIYLFLANMLFAISDQMNNREDILKGLNVTTWGLIAFYVINVLKNVTRLLPGNSPGAKLFRYMYFLLSLEFVKKLPHMRDFQKSEQFNEGEK